MTLGHELTLVGSSKCLYGVLIHANCDPAC